MAWQPRATNDTLRQRARLLAAARTFFLEREVLEVETPALVNHAVTDPHLANLTVQLPDGRTLFLHTSPEFHMKRLLAAGAPDIWQLGKVFRAGEAGPHHEPEFTLIEWYRHAFTLAAMARETCDLLSCLGQSVGTTVAPPNIRTYRDVFLETLGIDPLDADTDALRTCARAHLADALSDTLENEPAPDRETWLDLLMSHAVAPSLANADVTVITHFPASQAALARLAPEDPRVAERFEIFCRGIEVANGYRELRDAAEQRQRFERDRSTRRRLGLVDVAPDADLVAALVHGLPDCAGVAVGFDRVMMALLGLRTIQDGMSFPAGGG